MISSAFAEGVNLSSPAEELEKYYSSLSDEERSQLIAQQCNMNNEGVVLYHDGWIYSHQFPGESNMNRLVKCRLDGSEQEALVGRTVAGYLSVYEDYLYYCTLWTMYSQGIYRISLIDDEVECVKAVDNIIWMQIHDGKIYYIARGNQAGPAGPLYCCRLDGEDAEIVLDKNIRFGFFVDKYFLYQDKDDGETIHITEIGGEDIKITNEVSYCPIYDGEYLYYDHRDSDGSKPYDSILCKIRLDGTDYQEIKDFEGYVYNHSMFGDNIYFTETNSNNMVYFINKNGGEIQQFSTDIRTNNIYTLQNMIVYICGGYNGSGLFAPQYTKFFSVDGELIFQL